MLLHRSMLIRLAVALGAAAAGCGSTTMTPPHPAAHDAAAMVGLEASWWVVDDPYAEHVGRVLADAAANPVPAPPSQVLQWWSAGVRVVRVDAGQLEALRTALRVTPPVKQARIGISPRWGVLAAGIPWNGTRVLDVAGEALNLPAGRVRLLGRAWVAPGTDGPPGQAPPARLRVDLVPQHVSSAGSDDVASVQRRLGLVPRLETADEGLRLVRMGLELEMEDGSAVLLVPDRPEHVWSGWQAGSAAPRPADDIGPLAPAGPDLGGLLLTDWSGPSGAALRVIVVLRAHVPPHFEILPGG